MGTRVDSTADSIRRSVEVEYWVIDEQGALTPPGSLAADCDGVEREFVKPLLEIKTPPCTSTAELRSQLLDRIQTVLTRANNQGKKLVPLSTPVNGGEIEDFDSERTAIQDEILGEDFEHVRHCAGTHVHVEQQPGAAVDQLNTLIALDPALALVNSCSYYRGERLTPGARSTLYRRLAYRTLPMQGQLWSYADERDAYARRVQRCYEEFVTEAIIRGIDRQRVESTFTAEGAVWTPVQFRHQFSTVEWRSPDTALPGQILHLADDVVSVVDRAVNNEVRIEGSVGGVTDFAVTLPTFETVEEHVETAIKEGLAPSVESYLDRMGFDVSTYSPLSREFDVEASISKEEAWEIRLEYANRLESDVQQMRQVVAD